MTDLAIPDPGLVLLIGSAGAGKSTFAARHFQADEVLSSDAYRRLLSGEEANQRATRAAFKAIHLELERRLARRQLTVIDATNVERSARRALLNRAALAGVPAVAIVLDLPTDVILARNAARPARVVDVAVVRRHLARLREALDGARPSLRDEGFARVVVLTEVAEVEAIRIVRQAR